MLLSTQKHVIGMQGEKDLLAIIFQSIFLLVFFFFDYSQGIGK